MAAHTTPTYLSHSYRPEDRTCNEHFWSVFGEQGFYFAVDPPSDIPTDTHLERMMNESSCYVGVVNARSETPKYGCSPFILFEFGLSVQAQRPRLLLVDQRISKREPFCQLPAEEVIPFSADPVATDETNLKRAIKRLRHRALRLPDPQLHERGAIGILVPREKADRAYGGPDARQEIKHAAALHMFDCCEILVPNTHNAMFALELGKCEAVVLDVRGSELPPWVFAYVYGRLIPSIKLVHVGSKELASDIRLPPLVEGMRMDENEPGVESVIYWREPDDLLHQLLAAFKKLNMGPTRLTEQHQGLSYFGSIGRRPARVFISNSSAANPLAGALVQKFTMNNIDTFQYKEEGAIEVGTNWAKKIRAEAESCDVFVALLEKGYSKSEWCEKELKIAIARARRDEVALFPYNIDPQDTSFKPWLHAHLKEDFQVPDLGNEPAAAVDKIFKAIDARLQKKESRRNWKARQPLPLGASREAIIDALRYLPKESWTILVDKLAAAQIQVPLPDARAKLQPRATAEELVFGAQRAEISREMAEQRISPLSYMVQELVSLVADDRRKPVLRSIVKRMQESFHADP
jgi:hypothetical protein